MYKNESETATVGYVNLAIRTAYHDWQQGEYNHHPTKTVQNYDFWMNLNIWSE